MLNIPRYLEKRETEGKSDVAQCIFLTGNLDHAWVNPNR